MITQRHIIVSISLLSAMLLVTCTRAVTTMSPDKNKLVRVAVIEVDTSHIAAYNAFLREEIEASIRLEEGVITLYGVTPKDSPHHVILFETYQDSSQYRSHLTTPHFQKYKQGTIQMVKSLDLIQMQAIVYHRKPSLVHARAEDLYVRLIKMELNDHAVEDFSKLENTVLLQGIKYEPGMLVMYAVSEKNNPARVNVLEVYEDVAAYNNHVETTHYLKYNERLRPLVKSLRFIDLTPILLGSKPQ